MRRAFLLIMLATFAAGIGWWLLRPLPQHLTVRLTQLHSPRPWQSVAAPPATAPATPAATPIATPAATPLTTSSTKPTPSATAAASGGELALIVDDCGQWIETERRFVALDIPLTLSVLPDVPYSGEIAREAAAAGKGIMLHLPMEALSGIDPGRGKVTTAMSDGAIVAAVQADLAQVPLAQGVNNHEGSKASADPRVMHAVIGVLAQRGNLFFIDSRTNAASVGESTARDLGVPTAARDVFLDNRPNVAYSEAQLLAAAAIAREHGSAIAIGHPKPTTLEALRAMIPQLQASGIRFVLVADLVATNGR